MNWKRPAQYAQVSTCERFSVAKIHFEGGACYEAWRTRAHAEGPHLIATNLPTAEDARRVCEEDCADAAT